ncbi:MAG: tetratricopeptide repeat protein [Helicobacteraceae bacterium]|jgi:tetratricopeptide (TPR) repeat protein|nr:tetratricopeptide repeat protein [Helicobacteraceae bacterium]
MKISGVVLSFFIALSVFASQEAQETKEPKFIERDLIVKTDNEAAAKAYRIGTAMLLEDRALEASQYLLKAIELEPDFIDAIDHLGVAYRKLKMYDKAEEVYKRSIQIDSGNLVPYLNLALIYQMTDRAEESVQAYKTAAKLAPDDPEPYYGIGVAYRSIGDYKQSIVYFDEAIKRYKAQNSELIYDAYANQAENYYDLKSYKKALELYKIIVKRYPNATYCRDRIKELEAL